LVVGEYPGEFERRLGRPLADNAGQSLRAIFESVAPGRDVVYSLSLGCKPTFKRKPDGELVPDQDIPACVDACRPYMHQDIVDSDAKVIFLVGPLAGLSVLGETYRALSVRTGYGWFYNDGPKPVFFLPDPSYALSNRLIRMALEQDIATALQSPPSARLLDAQYTVVTTLEAARNALLECRKAPYIATDVETSGMMFEDDFRIECVATSTEDHVWVWPREYWFAYQGDDYDIPPDMPHPYMQQILSLPQTSWNGQYDYTAFQCDPEARYGYGYHDARVGAGSRSALYKTEHGSMNLQSDARIKRKLLEADAAADLGTSANLIGMGGHKQEAHTVLAAICDELRKYRMSFQTTPTGKTRKPPTLTYIQPAALDTATWNKWFEYLDAGFDEEKFAYRFMPKDILWRYCARDAFTTWHLEDWCNSRLILDPGMCLLWEEVSKPAMWAYCEMRMNGMPLDKGGLQLFAQYLETELKQVQAKIDGYKPGLNPGSSPQVGAYLSTLGIVPKKKTSSGKPSYSDDALEDFKKKHPIVDLILQHRELTKQLGTYAIGYGHFVRSDGYVHPSYLADGTESGRASSQDPNLFNVSKGRTERKKKLADKLRACFSCSPGWEIVEVDAGQIEIRGAAHLSGDPAMHEMLTAGTDFHMASAKKFAVAVGKDPEKVTDLDRENAKTSNFAAIYEIPSELGGMLAGRLGIPNKDGEALAVSMFQTYTRLRAWMEEQYSAAWSAGYSRTSWKGESARRRPLWGLGRNPSTLSDLEKGIKKDRENRKRYDLNAARSTYNGPVQGSSVDVIASHLWETVLWLRANTDGGKLILQVYDSIMVMVRTEDVEKTVQFLKTAMTQPLFGNTPLTADAKRGPSWGNMQKVK
jgi:uracil-DNA glycosylase family 4